MLPLPPNTLELPLTVKVPPNTVVPVVTVKLGFPAPVRDKLPVKIPPDKGR